MTNTNSVIIIGNLVRGVTENERDFGYVANGNARANVTIAVNRSKKQGDQWVDKTSYFDVTIWGKTAENLKPYLNKGQKICVKGFLDQDRWEKDGQKFSRVGIVAESVELCGTPNNNQNNASQMQNNYQQPVQNNQPQNNGFQAYNGPTANGSDYGNMDYEQDIPF